MKNQKAKLASCLLLLFIVVFANPAFSQSGKKTVTLPASLKYEKSEKYQKWWGKHYRREWATPVTFNVASLDTLAGGLVPYQAGGGRQTRSLRLRDKQGREYVLRSLNKTFNAAVPPILKGTFAEKRMDDQVSIGHPYASITIPPLAEAAGILYTNTRIFFIPKQNALLNFNEEFGDQLYVFEERPDNNWESARNLGNSSKIIGTDKMLERSLEDSDNKVDQELFLRTRLFDMLIGDWSRHADQWRWAEFKSGEGRVYKPVPRDRDQAYTRFDGKMLKILIPISGASHLQSFGSEIKDLRDYNYTARSLDHHFTNELTYDQWITIANDLQKRITDEVIEYSVKRIPSEVYEFSGPMIIENLKSRRDKLVDVAIEYYKILAEEIEIHGSPKNEFVNVIRTDSSTLVTMFRIKENNMQEVYKRNFLNRETDEIRIYGIGGNDSFAVSGSVRKAIKVRLIGGSGEDIYMDNSTIRTIGKRNKIYDSPGNTFRTTESSLHLSADSSIHEFKWDDFSYDKRSIRPIIFYNNDDRIYASIAWIKQTSQWRKEPFGNKQYFDVKYSISQKAFSTTYKATFTDLVGNFDVDGHVNFDFIRWTNFFGLGNETLLETKDRDFNRMRSQEFFSTAGLVYRTKNKHRFSVMPFYQTIKIINDQERFVPKNHSSDPELFNTNQYTGADIQYVYQVVNDSILPRKGFRALVGSNYTIPLRGWDENYLNFYGVAEMFLPLSKRWNIVVKAGGSAMSGNPEFFLYNSIGGSETLRGYQRNRFYGNSTVYNQNEIRWVKDVTSNWYAGKFGLFALYDIGRVWLDDEKSDKIHSGYGLGIILSPFNRISAKISYAKSREDGNFHLQLIRPV